MFIEIKILKRGLAVCENGNNEQKMNSEILEVLTIFKNPACSEIRGSVEAFLGGGDRKEENPKAPLTQLNSYTLYCEKFMKDWELEKECEDNREKLLVLKRILEDLNLDLMDICAGRADDNSGKRQKFFKKITNIMPNPLQDKFKNAKYSRGKPIIGNNSNNFDRYKSQIYDSITPDSQNFSELTHSEEKIHSACYSLIEILDNIQELVPKLKHREKELALMRYVKDFFRVSTKKLKNEIKKDINLIKTEIKEKIEWNEKSVLRHEKDEFFRYNTQRKLIYLTLKIKVKVLLDGVGNKKENPDLLSDKLKEEESELKKMSELEEKKKTSQESIISVADALLFILKQMLKNIMKNNAHHTNDNLSESIKFLRLIGDIESKIPNKEFPNEELTKSMLSQIKTNLIWNDLAIILHDLEDFITKLRRREKEPALIRYIKDFFRVSTKKLKDKIKKI